MGAVVHGPGEGERLPMGASEAIIKATGEDTGGTFFLSESVIEPGFPGPPPHTHERMHDMFYVLEGELTFRLGDEERPVSAGTFVCAPPGVVHTFSNPGDKPARLLNFSTPSGFEHYMRELAEAAQSGTLNQQSIGEIASRHDVQVAR